MRLALFLLSLSLSMLCEARSPTIHSSVTNGKTTYVLWEFEGSGKCSYFMVLVKDSDPVLLSRRLYSCSGVASMRYEHPRLYITVPSDDVSNQTLTYTYILRNKSWLDTGRP